MRLWTFLRTDAIPSIPITTAVDSYKFDSHKDTVNTVMECCPVSSRLITIRLRAVPFNITIVQAYASTSDYDDNKIEEF